jgi:hypothetical protein
MKTASSQKKNTAQQIIKADRWRGGLVPPLAILP